MRTAILICFILISFGSVSALVMDSVVMDSESVSHGETFNIEIGLRNNGETDITDVSVFLDLKDLPLAPFDSSSEFGIDKIKENRIQFAEFKITALDNAESKTYKIPVQVSYNEEGETKTRSSLISVKVNSPPVLEVVAEENLLLKGTNNKVNLKIINRGLSDAQYLEIEAKESVRYKVISPDKIYIGDVDGNDFDSVEFMIFLDKNTKDKIVFPVAMRYSDVFNNKYENEFEIQLRTYTKNEAVKLGLLKESQTRKIIIGVIVVIFLWFVYRWWRKKNKKKEEY